MSKYKDEYGVPIKEGDVVLCLVTINQVHFKPFAFTTSICRKKGRFLVLEGVHSISYLQDTNPSEIIKVTADTDMRKAQVYFLRLQHTHYSGEECQ